MNKQKYNQEFTLFLDRDGVINKRLPGRYVRLWQEFSFLPGVLETIAQCSKIFGRIIIVTNQQGIGRGLMDSSELNAVHEEMLKTIQHAGGRIDAIYYCPDLRTQKDNCRKPNSSMGLQAKADFPSIDFDKAIMVGDSVSDVLFGKQLGMETVFITSNQEQVKQMGTMKDALPNHAFNSLLDWRKCMIDGEIFPFFPYLTNH